jgi:hypothetical protein
VASAESHLRPDGTVWPPVTPETPPPPGYHDPMEDDTVDPATGDVVVDPTADEET